MVMILCAGGELAIGGALDGARIITVAPFRISDTAVSRAQWRAVRRNATGYALPPGRGDGPQHPIYGVSLLDAAAWCNALSEQQGRTPVYRRLAGPVYTGGPVPGALRRDPDADGVRLPLEQEWEWAARRGGLDPDDSERPTANTVDRWPYVIRPWSVMEQGAGDILQWTNGPPTTEAVDADAPDSLGCHHIAGNVWEWTWHRRFRRGRMYGVLRGGSVLEPQRRCTPRRRVICNAEFRLPFVGLRVAR